MQQFTGKHPCRSSALRQIAFRHGCSLINLLHIFRITFPKNNSGWLLLTIDNNVLPPPYPRRLLLGSPRLLSFLLCESNSLLPSPPFIPTSSAYLILHNVLTTTHPAYKQGGGEPKIVGNEIRVCEKSLIL